MSSQRSVILVVLTLLIPAGVCAQVWTRMSSSGPPRATLPTMAYDAARQRVVWFDGSNSTANTWEWDGATWTRRNAAISPAAPGIHAMTYDAARERIVLLDSAAKATWEWDGVTWTQRSAAPAPSFNAIPQPFMTYDAARRRVVAIGNGSASRETWEWDGSTWTFGGNVPIFGPIAYDAARQRTIAQGNGLTFEWDGNAWTQVPVLGPQIPGYVGELPQMAYDAARARLVLAGIDIVQSPPRYTATWEWSGSAWVLPPLLTNPGVQPFRLAYDERRRTIVMAGAGETWEYGFTPQQPPSTPWLEVQGAPRIGATVGMQLTASMDAGRTYQVASSLGSGTIVVGSRRIGLAPDGLFQVSVDGVLPGIFRNYRGVIPASGVASASVAIPNVQVLVGVTVFSAFVTVDPAATFGMRGISLSKPFTITP